MSIAIGTHRSRAIRSLGLAFVFVAAACSSSPRRDTTPIDTSPDTIPEFLEAFATAFCLKSLACDTAYQAYTQDECETLVLADFGPAGSVEARGYALDPDAAAGCLALIDAMPACVVGPSADDFCLEEGGAFVGTSAAGSACDSDAAWLCGPGTLCSADRFSGACGTCETIPRVALGEPCASTESCIQTATTLAYCDFDPIDAREECIAWPTGTVVGIGADCGAADTFCDVGAECAWNTDETCHAQIALGAECDPNGDIGCIGRAPCVETPSSTLGGICRALVVERTVGQPCGLVGTDFVECSAAASLVCNETTSLCEALVPAAIGAPCDFERPCVASAQCDWTTDSCVALLADGASCDGGDECLSGFCFGPDGASVCGNLASLAVACTP